MPCYILFDYKLCLCLSYADVDTKPLEDETEQAYCQRVLTNYPPDFIWVIRRDNISWNQLDRFQQINRFPKAYFTTKV